MKDIRLDDMRLFVSVVQAGSLSKAAQLTGVPISRLSRRLSELESALGTQLMNRGKQGITPNPLGEAFFHHAQEALWHAQNAIDSVQLELSAPKGLLRISAPFDITQHLLTPILDDYLAQYPNVDVDINLSQQKINMIQDGIDIALRVGTIENDNVVAKKVRMIHSGIFATKAYLAKYGTPNTPYDLYQHKVIGQTLSFPWMFLKDEECLKISPQSHIGCNDFLLIEEMIVKGVGIGRLSNIITDKHPELVPVLTDWRFESVPLSLIYYKNRGSMPLVRSFIDWFIAKQSD